MKITVSSRKYLKGSPVLPGDKSVSHRALLFSALAEGTSRLTGLSGGEDVRSTARCLGQLGVSLRTEGELTTVHGVGLRGFQRSASPLDCGNSGSTSRMLMGVLAGQSFLTKLTGDESLSRRPMKRVAEPLMKMGAQIEMHEGTYLPLTVKGVGELKPIDYELKVASAQVKSAVILAALYAKGESRLTGRLESRDHTERVLPHFGARLTVGPSEIRLEGGQRLHSASLKIPGDPSSAAFWVAATQVVKDSEVRIEDLLLNPTRTGFFRVLRRMGARVEERMTTERPEPVGSLLASHGRLRGTTVMAEEVPALIDEIPLLAVLATFAEGVTEVRGAEELRVKETDRIEAMAENLRRLGARIETFEDGFRIEGPQTLTGAEVDSFGDHRVAMAFAIAALGTRGETTIANAESVSISYPAFFDTLERLTRG